MPSQGATVGQHPTYLHHSQILSTTPILQGAIKLQLHPQQPQFMPPPIVSYAFGGKTPSGGWWEEGTLGVMRGLREWCLGSKV